jgi:capsular polysaccharide biosynthesis protein
MEEIDIRELFSIIWKRKWIVVIITILAALISGIVSHFFLSEIYSSSTTLIVNKQNNPNREDTGSEIDLSDVNLARNLVGTYSVIVRSNRVLDKVIDDLGLNMSLGALKSKINVTAEGNTQIIRVTVEDTIPERARDIANSVSNIFKNEVQVLMGIDNVQIIDTARVSYTPVRPNLATNIAIAVVLGMMLGVGIIYLIELLDNTIKTAEDVQKYLDLPVLGVIPGFDNNFRRGDS